MSQTKLLYFADPMCSWCYGFSPELTKVVEQMDESIELKIILGGLRPYNTETMTQLGDFLNGHWKEVAHRSNQPFSYDILQDSSFVYDTEPACRAVVLMRQLRPEETFSFFKAIQTAFYKDNQNTNLTSTYLALLGDFDVDKKEFETAFQSDELKALVKEDFTYAANIGVRGFPTLVLQNGDDYHLISNGYLEANKVLEAISKVINTK